MSASDRPLLRLFVHCRERKFVQVARPSDSIGDLACDIQSKFSKLYAGAEIQAARLQCTDGFDLDLDDAVADVFQDRDHVYVNVSSPEGPASPPKRLRSPPTTPRTTVNVRSGGSPIQQKITPVSTLPIAKDTPQKAPKSDDDHSSLNRAPLSNAVPAQSEAPACEQAPEERSPSLQCANMEESATPPKADDVVELAPAKRPTKSKKRAAAKSAAAPKEPVQSVEAVVAAEPETPAKSSPSAVSGPAKEDQLKTSKHSAASKDGQPKSKKQKKKAVAKTSDTAKDVTEAEPEEVAEEENAEIENVPEPIENDDDPKADGASQDEMTTCKKCGESMTKKSLKAHHKLHYEFSCKQCSKKFGSDKGLDSHMKKAH